MYNKEISKEYANKRNVKVSTVEIGDSVLLKRQGKRTKFQSNYEPEPCIVFDKTAGQVTFESGKGKLYKRSVTHVKKFNGENRDSINYPIEYTDYDDESQSELEGIEPTEQVSSNESSSPVVHNTENVMNTPNKLPPLDSKTLTQLIKKTRAGRAIRKPLRFCE